MRRLGRALDGENMRIRIGGGMEVEISQEEDGRDGGQPGRQGRSRDCQKHYADGSISADLPVIVCPSPFVHTQTSGVVS